MEDESRTNKELQVEEMQALAAIFEHDFILISDSTFSITLCNSHLKQFYIQVSLPETYPLLSPPKYEISAPWMERKLKKILREGLEKICSQYRGECVIYVWIDFIRDFIEQDSFVLAHNQDTVTDRHDNLREDSMPLEKDQRFISYETQAEDLAHGIVKGESLAHQNKKDEIPPIVHGVTIIDKKSCFQAHLARVVSVDQVSKVLKKLKENKKIVAAKHNVYAYRIKYNNGTFDQESDNDGEPKAGAVLLQLLEVLNLTNIIIVVTRWYGGIHLGSDRFRHYKDAANHLINAYGLTKDRQKKSK